MTKREELQDVIVERIKSSGPVTFRAFMEAALYEPKLGYYASDEKRIGRAGDYYTSPTSTPLFGKLIARWLTKRFAELDSDVCSVVEMGAGPGVLSADIKTVLADEAPDICRTLEYFEVDYIDRLPDLDTACLISNELIDAFPVHRVRMTQNGLREIFVDFDGNRFIDVEGGQSTPDLSAYLDNLGVKLPAGFTTEINLDAVNWIRAVAGCTRRGYVLTIDYGYESDELYAPYRSNGTLVGYRKHEVVEDIYANIGQQDLTSHVNFSALIKYGEAAGLEMTEFTTQSKFLIGLGAMELLEALQKESVGNAAALKSYLALKDIIMPDGMGGVFKVLVQRKV